ncbi:MAG: hypothetical protein WCG97_02330 [bacterium]
MIKSNESFADSSESSPDIDGSEFIEVPQEETEGFVGLGEKGFAGLKDVIGADKKEGDRKKIEKLTKELHKVTKKNKK